MMKAFVTKSSLLPGRLFLVFWVAFTLFSTTLAFPPPACQQLSKEVLLAARLGWHQGWKNYRTSNTRLFMNGGDGDGMSRRKVFQIVGGTIVALPLVGEVYARSGSTKQRQDYFFQPSLPKSFDNIDEVTLVFHGAGGQDNYTDNLMQVLINKDSSSSYSAIVDWSNASQNILQASFNAQNVGRRVASQLLEKAGDASLKNIHVIGISVGAFAADAAVTHIKQATTTKVNVQLTLLDPLCQRGILAFTWGNVNFGKDADYTQQYLNTDDPVPSTNSAVQHAVCYDVTPLRPPEIFGHDWPLIYYTQSKDAGKIVPPQEQKPPGTVITVSS